MSRTPIQIAVTAAAAAIGRPVGIGQVADVDDMPFIVLAETGITVNRDVQTDEPFARRSTLEIYATSNDRGEAERLSQKAKESVYDAFEILELDGDSVIQCVTRSNEPEVTEMVEYKDGTPLRYPYRTKRTLTIHSLPLEGDY